MFCLSRGGVELLRPGGRMGIVLPHNIVGGEALGYVRRWLLKKGRLLGAIGLGRHTFLPHTHQKTSLLLFQREAVTRSDYNIFFAVSERAGKDSRGKTVYTDPKNRVGWEAVDHDFSDILNAFETFCRNEGLAATAAA